jgi:thiosulfate/3-mercaptopyruvate sulfurtransferase
VVVSAGVAPADFSAAARVYWSLKVAGHDRVSILEGGFEAWRSAGQPIETGPSARPVGPPYPVQIEKSMRATVADVEEAITRKTAALLDGRSQAQFEGRDKSPQVGRAGRLPGAVHLDHSQAFELGTGRLRPAAELEEIFGALTSGPVVSYCNTGHLASTNWFVLSEVLGRPGISLYDGSMSEWTQDPGRPVATGAAGSAEDHQA